MRLPITRQHLPVLAALGSLLMVYTIACYSFWDKHYFTAYNFCNLFNDSAVLGIAAIGMAFVILSGGIDLSVGAIVGLVSIATAVMVEQYHIHPVIASLIMLAAGLVVGLGHGLLIALFDLPPFLVTLAGMFLCRGLALYVSEAQVQISHDLVTKVSEAAVTVGSGRDAGLIRVGTGIFIFTLFVGTFMSIMTRFGRNIYAIGGNENSSRLMGLPATSTKVALYALSGFCSALAGIVLMISNGGGGDASANQGLELDAIAAVVIGGTLLSGGVGYVASTILGALILGVIQSIVTFNGNLTAGWTKVIVGGLLLVFVVIQKIIEAATRGRKA